MSEGQPRQARIIFRIPATALLAAGLVIVCATPLAFAVPGLQALYLLPIGFAVWVVRNRTVADGERLVARSTFSSRTVRWDDVKAIKLSDRWLGAVLADDSVVTLPAVRTGHLAALEAVSGGRVTDPATALARARAAEDDETEADGAGPDEDRTDEAAEPDSGEDGTGGASADHR
ncbi:PH domain-containing protein [Umezawaea beigongshangensis]|uniref:PH domain-containing protein n=1 Tax=Umezawaea beigongshangensis TaxID=2780383 RepID=UPI0018F135B6|nr:PH domain-containing protein [Umezawaea beigongshangensis]